MLCYKHTLLCSAMIINTRMLYDSINIGYTSFILNKCDCSFLDLINSTVFRTHLTFSSVALEDIGSYKCMATSSYGEAESRVILDLVGE